MVVLGRWGSDIHERQQLVRGLTTGFESSALKAQRVELAGASESIEPARRKKASSSNETERNIEAGAGIEPANRFTIGEAILYRR